MGCDLEIEKIPRRSSFLTAMAVLESGNYGMVDCSVCSPKSDFPKVICSMPDCTELSNIVPESYLLETQLPECLWPEGHLLNKKRSSNLKLINKSLVTYKIIGQCMLVDIKVGWNL